MRPLRGSQTPRICVVPDYGSSAGSEAVELAASAGLDLDPWQQLVIKHGLGERDDGLWAAFEVAVEVPRQNGKGGIIETRELAGLFLLDEPLIIHTAHLFDTSLEAFRRLLMLIEMTPDFDRRVQRVSRAHGEEGIELKGGQRIRFRTRTRGGGRGWTGDCCIFDECMEIQLESHGALLPTLSAVPNPQLWYFGSAVDMTVHQHGLVIASIRKRALEGEDHDLCYVEWSVDRDRYEKDPDAVASDPTAWAQSNPALGIRITADYIAKEKRAMKARPRTFAVERLNIGYWPDPDKATAERVISDAQWSPLADLESELADPGCLSFDVSPDRSVASIAAAGAQEADAEKTHVEVIDHRSRTSGLAKRLVELVVKHEPVGIVYDGVGPSASVIPELERLLAEEGIKIRKPDETVAGRSIEIKAVSASEYGQACGMFYDDVDGGDIVHLDQDELNAAIASAAKRRLGERWAWSRSNSAADITPVVSVTLAAFGHHTIEPAKQLEVSNYRIRRL